MARVLRQAARWLGPVACVVLGAAAPAAAQTGTTTAPAPGAEAEGGPAILLLMDASLSMGKDAGGGTTRIDAAKSAVGDVVGALPDDAEVGLRVYGARVDESTRAEGCRDTELVAPVEAGGGPGVVEQIEALAPKGRTPIGRSLRESPDDFPDGAERKTLVLVSDGGDNCAPPDPCEVAEEVAQQGVELTIQVIGLRVSERVREQLECIAEAGGGTYTGADDPQALADELRAAFARARRTYEPSGTPVDGGPVQAQAAPIGAGQYLDAIAPGEEKWYAVPVGRAQRLWTSAVPIAPDGVEGGGVIRTEIVGADGEDLKSAQRLFSTRETTSGPIEAEAVRGSYVEVGGSDDFATPGTYFVRVALADGNLDATEIPIELLVQVLDPDQPPRAVPVAASDPPDAPPEDPDDVEPPASAPEAEQAGGDGALLAGVGLGAVALGALGAWFGPRRRRPT